MMKRGLLRGLRIILGPNLYLSCALAVACALSVVSCGGEDLLVFAATSLRDPLTELSREYQTQSGVNVNISFGASQSLAQQIASGAPADVFISAGAAPMDFLDQRGFVSNEDSRRLLGNELVVVMLDDAADMDSLSPLASDSIDRLALADPALAPAGAYARESLLSEGIWDRLQSKLLLGKDVRAAMTYVEVGNADAGIVYRTDARSSDSLRIVHTINPVLHSPIVYPAVAISDSHSHENVSEFLDFLSSDESMSVFRRFGFSEPPAE